MNSQRGGRGAWRGKGRGGSWRERVIKSAPPHSLKPSQEYLRLVSSCSEPENSTPPRKLFVLSLGNTLTLRTGNRNAPTLRAYLPVFMHYITRQETREWADVMVWSAAAKRNVMPGLRKAMRVVIGDGNKGKSDRQDRRMSSTSARTDAQYVEDEVPFWDGLLRDVWTQEVIAKLKGEERKPVVHTPAPKPKDLSLAWTSSSFAHRGGENLQAHDAHTTLLLDDTPTSDCTPQHPYNHLRLGSFDEEVHREDVQVMERIERERNYSKRMMHNADDGLPDLASLSLSDKTQDKPEEPGESEDPEEWTGPGYDITLLAVIGIFEEMRRQSSVAAWVKNGGLWGDPYGFHSTRRTQDKKDELGSEHFDAVSKTQDKGEVKGARIQPESDPEKISATVGNGVSERYSRGNDTKTWFDDEQIVRYWAVKGREACRRLRIDPDEHGL